MISADLRSIDTGRTAWIRRIGGVLLVLIVPFGEQHWQAVYVWFITVATTVCCRCLTTCICSHCSTPTSIYLVMCECERRFSQVSMSRLCCWYAPIVINYLVPVTWYEINVSLWLMPNTLLCEYTGCKLFLYLAALFDRCNSGTGDFSSSHRSLHILKSSLLSQ